MNLALPKISMTVVASILVTGAILNLMGSGVMGETAKKISAYVTKGYGV